MRKPNRNLQYADLAKKANLVRAFEPVQGSGNSPEVEQASKKLIDPNVVIASRITDIAQTYKRSTAGKTDTPFDVSIRRTGDRYGALAVGASFVYGRYVVPNGQKFTMQSYLFWAEVDNRPVVAYPVIAEPNELWGLGDFHMYVNGQVPMYNPYWINATEYEGYPITSKDINADSNPNSPGISVIARGGTEITVTFRRLGAGLMYRTMMAIGVRLRGFFSPEFANDQDER